VRAGDQSTLFFVVTVHNYAAAWTENGCNEGGMSKFGCYQKFPVR
jgi:hypothetical protein